MIKKLIKQGNSFALIIDKPILRLLGITESTKLHLQLVEDALIIKPLNPARNTIIKKSKKTKK